MKKKNKIKKNPIYVVKGKDVHPVNGIFEMAVQKLNLTPLIELIESLLDILVRVAKNYVMVKFISELLDTLIKRVELFRKFSFA